MTTRKKLVIGNWKMNGDRPLCDAVAGAVGNAIRGHALAPDVVICPPYPYISIMATGLSAAGIGLGAQDVSPHMSGAYTGDVSARMLVEAGAGFVLVGHSERRANHAEDNALVSAKAEAAHKAGLTSIICVGESLQDREGGVAFDVVREQVVQSLPVTFSAQNTVIAYEPVWAIGTGRVATPADIESMHALIRIILQEKLANSHGLRIVYGGSVKADNAAAILSTPHVDGVLVGGASLDPSGFAAIIAAATGQ